MAHLRSDAGRLIKQRDGSKVEAPSAGFIGRPDDTLAIRVLWFFGRAMTSNRICR